MSKVKCNSVKLKGFVQDFGEQYFGTEGRFYEGESNENRKTEIKIRNIAPLSYKLADMLPML
jgi:hypothetical protein